MKIGFLNLLTLIFVAAKLFGYVTWSWWFVFAPTFLSVGLGVFFLLLFLVAAALKD